MDQVQLRLGSSWLRVAGRLGSQLGWQGRWQVNPRDWRRDQALPPWLTRDALAGTLRLTGTRANPVLAVRAAQRSNPIVGPWQASLRWQDQILELQGLQSPQLQAKGSLPLALLPGRGLVPASSISKRRSSATPWPVCLPSWVPPWGGCCLPKAGSGVPFQPSPQISSCVWISRLPGPLASMNPGWANGLAMLPGGGACAWSPWPQLRKGC